MRRLSVIFFIAFLSGCSASVDGGLSADQAKVSLTDKAMAQYEKLSSEIASGALPSDAGRLPREVGAMKPLLTGDLKPLGDKLEKQVADFETILDAKKPDAAKAKAALQEIGATLQEIKAKL